MALSCSASMGDLFQKGGNYTESYAKRGIGSPWALKRNGLFIEMNHRSDRFSLMHQVEGFVDILQPHRVCDEGIEFEFSVQVALHIPRQFGAAFYPPKCRAAPDASRYQLKRAGADFFASTSNANDDGFSPTF